MASKYLLRAGPLRLYVIPDTSGIDTGKLYNELKEHFNNNELDGPYDGARCGNSLIFSTSSDAHGIKTPLMKQYGLLITEQSASQ